MSNTLSRDIIRAFPFVPQKLRMNPCHIQLFSAKFGFSWLAQGESITSHANPKRNIIFYSRTRSRNRLADLSVYVDAGLRARTSITFVVEFHMPLSRNAISKRVFV